MSGSDEKYFVYAGRWYKEKTSCQNNNSHLDKKAFESVINGELILMIDGENTSVLTMMTP